MTAAQPQQPWIATAGASRSEDDDADERLTRSGAPEVRGDNSIRQDAERRDMELMSDAELEALIRDEFDNTTLANPPSLPGYHLCWLTTTSQYDTLQKRARVGYTPVQRSEMPNFDPSNGEAIANYEGAVTCNELVLHKIPQQRYQVMMNLFHHKQPLESEAAILTKIREAGGEADSNGRSLVESEMGDGISTLERSVKQGSRLPAPRF